MSEASARLLPGRRSERVQRILVRALKARGMARKLPRHVSAEAWESAVGPQLAARAQPTVLASGVLHVLVEDHRWRDQLDAARVMLVERLNRVLGGAPVRRLQFGLAHSGALAAGRRRLAMGACDGPAPCLEGILGGAQLEPGLREALLRAAEAAARRR